jgi:hypothetical protein
MRAGAGAKSGSGGPPLPVLERGTEHLHLDGV